MSNRIYDHLNFRPKVSDIKFSGSGRGSENLPPDRPSDYHKQKRKELEDIKKALGQDNKPISTTLKISGETNRDVFYERLDTSKGDL